MLRSDAQNHRIVTEDLINNSDIINDNVISEIERELQDDPYDLTSLVFLLYDIPDTALQRLIVYQRVSGDAGSTNLNLLQEWFRHANSRPTWKHEFLEALVICQLYSIVRKLGFHVPSMKRHYKSKDMSTCMYVNPVRKILYKVCENITSANLMKLKKSLLTYEIDTSEYDTCEMIFLELMSQKFITINQYQYNKQMLGCKFNMEKLIKIIENMTGLKKLAIELRDIQNIMNNDVTLGPVSSTPMAPPLSVDEPENNKFDNTNFDELFEMIGNLQLEGTSNKNLKSDTKKLGKDAYKIKDTKRVGVCLIINQENFYPSKESIDNCDRADLETRLGSTIDKLALEKTMLALNFKVYSESDLDHKKMIAYIKDIIQYKVHSNDSIFILCILSHGVRGHVYAADSVKVKVEYIQSLLDSEDAIYLRNMPKVLIIQACQVNENHHSELVADGKPSNYYIRKLDFLIYWATAPEYEAYRYETRGSIFIQTLCKVIQERAKLEHANEIFTKVTNKVAGFCTMLQRAQVPMFESTLRKILYLQIPE